MEISPRERWAPLRAEALLAGLDHVVRCRMVTGTHGRVTEVHVLADDRVPAKRIVRDIESALFVHFGRQIDRRKISVAQVSERSPAQRIKRPEPPRQRPAPAVRQGRLILVGHQITGERAHRVGARVTIDHRGKRFEGSAHGADVAQSRLETLAKATLRAVEAAAWSHLEPRGQDPISLHLEGLSLVGGDEHPSLLLSVSAANGRDVMFLAGAVQAAESQPRAAILASLQATDRWVRGQLKD